MTLPFFLIIAGAWFGFANPLYHVPPMALLFPAGLILLGLRTATVGTGFRTGWLAGSMAYAAALYWIVIPVHVYGGFPLILALPCPLLLGFYMGLYPGLFCMLVRWSRDRLSWPLAGLLAACGWTVLELVRGWLFTGFPWLVLPSAFSPWPLVLQASAFTGTFILAGLLVLPCAWLIMARGHRLAVAGSLLLFAALTGYGFFELRQPLPEGDSLSVGIIQGNIDQNLKWDDKYQDATVDHYLQLSRELIADHDPDLLVWPETALPFYFQDDGPLSRKVREFTAAHEVLLLVGAPGYEPGEVDYAYFNRAFLVGPDGSVQGTYDKQHLVPFGEYVPLRPLFPFMSKLVSGVGDFEAGSHDGPLTHANLALGVLICYETIFPELTVKRVAQGANVLVNISNDAWFGASSAPWQHLHLAVLRAVEQQRYLIRATNTGISACIDPRGNVLNPSPLFETSSIYCSTIHMMTQTTFFNRYHTALHAGTFLTLALIMAYGVMKNRNRAKRF
ncbi:MAG: apolipoprotein N-acyltransferase [Desulfovibrionales bacterium]